MRMAIHHETFYRYRSPASYSIQYLRLTPQTNPRQRVLSWKIDVPGPLHSWVDAFGNQAHVLVIDRPHEEIRIQARGEVEVLVEETEEGDDRERQAPAVYTRVTRLTRPDEALARFVERVRPLVEADRAEGLELLMRAVREEVEYEPGVTHAATPAADAFARRVGVCQDHAHIFVACCRQLGVPARYVSGYLDASADGSMASHAWAEAWIDDVGWRGYDVTNKIGRNQRHVRVAVGLDYLDACPVRGVRRGGEGESLEVAVRVTEAARHGQEQEQEQQ